MFRFFCAFSFVRFSRLPAGLRPFGLLPALVFYMCVSVPLAQADDLIGVIFARQEVDLCAEMAGRLDTILVEMGDRVARGTVLARLDDGLLRQDLVQAQAAQAARQAEAEGATVRAAEARSRHERHQASPDSWSAEELATVRMEMELARAELAGATAAVEREQAAVRRLEIMITAAEIKAPFDGAVAQLYETQGTFTGRGAKILRFISDRELWVRFAVTEPNAADLSRQQPIQVTVGTMAEVIQGTIHHLAPEIEATTKMMVVEAVLEVPENLAGKILSGMSARVRLKAGPED